MGKATRWLKGLLGMRKEKEKENMDNSSCGSNDKREKKRWSFAKLAKDSDSVGNAPENAEAAVSASHTAWIRSYIVDTESEQKKHAIAVATASAAAADAAVAAAQAAAAVAVVRLTNQGREPLLLGEARERSAAVKIQTVFRGFLARKALRALKALVKLQALVRGYLVRKQTTATFYSMQALIRAQTALRAQRARRSISKENRHYPENRPRKSIERFDETRSESHSKRLSTACHEVPLNILDESPKIVEIDTYMTGSRSRRICNSNTLSEYGEDESDQAMSSPIPSSIPGRFSEPDSKQFQDHDWYYLNANDCKFPTAQSTPRFANFARPNSPSTPAKSVCGDSFFRPYYNVPNYMANTQSFRAKLRSHSAPRQRPELGPKKLSLNEVMAARNSISSVRMHRPSYTHVGEPCNF